MKKYLTCKTWDNASSQIVTHVGVDKTKYPIKDVIEWIESNIHQIVVNVGGHETSVRVATSSAGNKFLTTNPDGSKCNNIDSLPTC